MDNTTSKSTLFLISKIALIATAMTFAIRANLIGDLGDAFNISSTDIGLIYGTAFWGFTISIIIGGTLCNILGLKRLLVLAFVGHLTGIVLTIFAGGFWSLFLSTLLIGIANGCVEAACNPLVAQLYPDQKTTKLNQFHVWFPGGIVIGGVLAYLIERWGGNWQLQTATILIPTLIYGGMIAKAAFPELITDGQKSSIKSMLKACLNPLFILMAIAMVFTAATELGTNQWIGELLTSAGISSILLLVFINGLMALGRNFAGSIERRLSPPGMLLFSAIFSAIGLYLLATTTGYALFGAAAVFATGICFFWPTMIGFVSEYLPKTGAIGMSIMGGTGMLSVALVLPYIGDLYDGNVVDSVSVLGNGNSLETLKQTVEGTDLFATWQAIKLTAGATTLKTVTLLPIILTGGFTLLYAFRKRYTQKA